MYLYVTSNGLFTSLYLFVTSNGLCTCVYLFVTYNRLCTANVSERIYVSTLYIFVKSNGLCTVYVSERMNLHGICLHHLTGYVRCMFMNVQGVPHHIRPRTGLNYDFRD